MKAINVKTEPIMTRYPIAHQDCAGISLNGILAPEASVITKNDSNYDWFLQSI